MALHEECGVFGIIDYKGRENVYAVYCGLIALQHRGQSSAGIAVSRGGEVSSYKDMGLATEVFTPDILHLLSGEIAIGHVRYAPKDQSVRDNAQPFVTQYKKGTLSLAHNGCLSNSRALTQELQNQGAIFRTSSDSELISYLIARERLKTPAVEDAVCQALPYLRGAYSLLIMSPRKLIAARDPYGFRPLCMGQRGNAIIFASESCALDAVGATLIRELEPGEVVAVTEAGVKSIRNGGQLRRCVFEYVYFARPDSIIDGLGVSEARIKTGEILARKYPIEADVVIGVPDSGLEAAIGYARYSGIESRRGFVKNSYMGRTFIRPSQAEREFAVRLKINPIRDAIEGKRIIMIDDSIVRGTTSAQIVKLLKSAGAKEVHMLVASPPFMHPCYFGTDIPSREGLAAVKYSHEEIREMIGADSLHYLDIEDLREVVGSDAYCQGCFTGSYPYSVDDPEAQCPTRIKELTQ